MHRSHRLTLCPAVLVLCFPAATGALAQDSKSYDLSRTPTFQPGDVVLMTSQGDEKTAVRDANGGMLESSHTTKKATVVYTVRKVKSGRVSEAEMIIVEASERTRWESPAKPTTAAAVKNLKARIEADGLRMKMDPNGVDPRKWDQLSPRAKQIAAAIAEMAFPAYPADNVMLMPGKPVAVGDTWKPDADVLKKWADANPQTKSVRAKVNRCEMKLAKVKDGVATVQGDIEVQMTVAGQDLEVPMEVEAGVDLASGRWVAVRKKGTMNMEMNGAKVTGKMTSRRTMKLNPGKLPDAGDDSDADKPRPEDKGGDDDKAADGDKDTANTRDTSTPAKDATNGKSADAKPAQPVDLHFRSSAKGDVLWGGEPISVQHQGGAKLTGVPASKAVSLSFYPADSRKAELVSLDLRGMDGDPMYAWYVPKSAARTVPGMGAAPQGKELDAEQCAEAGRTAAIVDAMRRLTELAGVNRKKLDGKKVLTEGTYALGGMTMTVRTVVEGTATREDAVAVTLPRDGKGSVTLTLENYLLSEPGVLKSVAVRKELTERLESCGIEVVEASAGKDGVCKAKLKAAGAVIYRLK